MKLSLAWIFDHIDVEPGAWQKFDVAFIARRFNEVTAEIEHLHPRQLDLGVFFLAFKQGDDSWRIDETGDSVNLGVRAPSIFIDETLPDTGYFVKKTATGYGWAALQDFGIDTDKLIPPVYAPASMLHGAWKKLWDVNDIIIEVDNKTVTNRPDMWGHRGFAREIAPFIGKKLRSAQQFLQSHPVKRIAEQSSTSSDAVFIIKNEEPNLCRAFNSIYLPTISNRACDIKILGRFLSVGARPMSAIVDLTNYVALDWGQPVHAYDADKIINHTVKIRKAKAGEELALLDGNTITLTNDDLVIADDKKPMCLAGIKGGLHDSLSVATRSVFLEAANFDASIVRRSSLHHKTRTDASIRFEKTLDSNLALEAVQRFLALVGGIGLECVFDANIIALGSVAQPKRIVVEHAFLEKRMGVTLSVEQVQNLLKALEFEISYDADKQEYAVLVPTFRASKDISIKEDILEEVVRTYGSEKIPLVLPTITRKPYSLVPLMRHRAIKRYLAQVYGATEMQNYALYDEGFLQAIDLAQSSEVALLNPVSENFKRLISSLIPGLLKNVVENHVYQNGVRFFESGRVWRNVNGKIEERKALAMCVMAKRTMVDFYALKDVIEKMFLSMGVTLDQISWTQVADPDAPWYRPHQTALLTINGQMLGLIGKGNQLILTKLGIQEEIDAAFIELDLEAILAMEIVAKKFVSLPKFQETYLDFSFMVPLALQANKLQATLQQASPLVQRVELIDFFEKESWDNQRSLTFRVWLLDHEGTIDKVTLDGVWQVAAARTQALGAVLRML